MNAKATVTLAFAAGLTGGIVSQLAVSTAARAQEPSPLPKEIRAEKFVIVDENGSPRGAFGIRDKDGWPILEVIDKKGNVYVARVAGQVFGSGKPSVVPAR